MEGVVLEQIHAHLHLHMHPESLGGEYSSNLSALIALGEKTGKLGQKEGRPAFHQLLLLYYLNFCHEYASLFQKKLKR